MNHLGGDRAHATLAALAKDDVEAVATEAQSYLP